MNNPDVVPTYNYAYIEEFNRYYFITDTIFNLGVWTLPLAVDLLASFKTDILNSRQYVIRSSSKSNPFIIDTAYRTYRDGDERLFWKSPQITSVTRWNKVTERWVAVDPFNQNLEDGHFVVGVVGSSETGVTYYVMGVTEFRDFLNQAFTTVPANMTDIEPGTASVLFNAVQYITSCRWYPHGILPNNTGSAHIRIIYVGPLKVDLGYADADCYALNKSAVEEFQCTVNLPVHPQVNANMEYLNLSPYTELGLYMQPFGILPIDTTKVFGSDRLNIHWYVDYCAGCANLEVRNNSDAEHGIIVASSAEYGVPLPISTMVYDWQGALAMGGANFIKTAIENDGAGFLGIKPTGNTVRSFWTGRETEQLSVPAELGGIGGSVAAALYKGVRATSQAIKGTPAMDLINTTINAAGSALGQLNTVGAQGSFLAYNMDLPYLYAWFTKIADTDPARFGYPLHENIRLDQLTGFCICLDAHVTYTSPLPISIEAVGVNDMLNSGVFIE